ncbi:MAG: hypothetical protein ACRC10_06385 [Thermoguttaceae bacterium]
MDETKSSVGSPPEQPDEMKTVSTTIHLVSQSSHRLRPPILPIRSDDKSVHLDGETEPSVVDSRLELPIMRAKSLILWNPFGRLFAPKYRLLNRVLTLSALFFALMLLVGYYAMQEQIALAPLNPNQYKPIRLSLVAPSVLANGVATLLELKIEDFSNENQSLPIRLTLRDDQGEELLVQHEMTDSSGQLFTVLEVPETTASLIALEVLPLPKSVGTVASPLHKRLASSNSALSKSALSDSASSQSTLSDSTSSDTTLSNSILSDSAISNSTISNTTCSTSEIANRLEYENAPGLPFVHLIPVVQQLPNPTPLVRDDVFKDPQPVELQLLNRDSLANEPLKFQVLRHLAPVVNSRFYVVITKNGIPITQKSLTWQETDPVVELPLSERISGLLNIHLFDGHTVPPIHVAQTHLFRRAIRHLKIEQLEPTEKMLPIRVVNEQGHPVVAHLRLIGGDGPLNDPAVVDPPLILDNLHELAQSYAAVNVEQFQWNVETFRSKLFLLGLLGSFGVSILILLVLSFRMLANPLPLLLIVLLGFLAFSLCSALHHQFEVYRFAVKTIREKIQRIQPTLCRENADQSDPHVPLKIISAQHSPEIFSTETDTQGYYQLMLEEWNVLPNEAHSEENVEPKSPKRPISHIRIEATCQDGRLGFAEIIR